MRLNLNSHFFISFYIFLYLFISFYIFLYLFISFYIFLYLFIYIIKMSETLPLPLILTITAAAQIEALASGTASNPSYSFIGDLNTGVSYIGADSGALSANGIASLTWDVTQVKVLSGLVTTPGYAFSAANDAGMLYTGTDTLLLATNGVERMRINGTGVVGNTGVSIGSAADAQANALLDLTSTVKGFLPPRMTNTQKEAMADIKGMVVYDTNRNTLSHNNGVSWFDVFSPSRFAIQTTDATVTTVYTHIFTDLTTTAIHVVGGSAEDAANATGSHFIVDAVYRRNGSTPVQISTTSKTVFRDDAAYDINVAIVGNNLVVTVTGKVAITLNWGGRVEVEVYSI
jgi:hypothetical protein